MIMMGLKNFLKKLFFCDGQIMMYSVLSLVIIISSYLIYLLLKEDTVIRLGKEDGLFEYLTALSFLATSILFLLIFFRRKKLIHLVFALVFFIGMGEEISWGQRIFNFQSPEYFRENNIQSEFNFHNLTIFDSQEEGGNYKNGLSYYLSMNFLYKLFWFIYGIVLPVGYILFPWLKKILDKTDLLVPPFVLGISFLLNWIIRKLILTFIVSIEDSPFYYYAATEIGEFGSAIIFLTLSAYFFKTGNTALRDVVRI